MNTPKIITYILALAFTTAPLVLVSSDAQAATHVLKKKSKKKTKDKKKTKKKVTKKTTRTVHRTQSGSRRVVRRTTTTRHSATGVHVGPTTRYRTNYRSRRTVHHHHHRSGSRTYYASNRRHRTEVRDTRPSPSRNTVDFYLRGGLGTSVLTMPGVIKGDMSAMDVSVELGGKGKMFGMDVGFNGANYHLDDGNSMKLRGFDIDLRLQPKFGILEPFATVGTGLYWLEDTTLQEVAASGTLKVTAGVEVHIHDIGLAVKYQWNNFNFTNEESYTGFGATSTGLMGSVSLYF